MATNHDTPANNDLEKAERSDTQLHTSHCDENVVEVNQASLDAVASNLAAGSDQSQEPKDTVRTLRGFKWFLAYGSLLSTVLLYALDSTVVADIQPAVIETFGETEKLPWMGTGMYLGALTILPLGKSYGIFNVKWLFLSVVVLFEVGSAVCGGAPNMDAFIVGRVIQGIGACGCYSGAITYVSRTTAIRERPLYLSGLVAMWAMGSVLGPVMGGAFAQSSLGWRWAFYINLCVAAVTAPWLILYLPNIDPAPHLTFKEKLRTQDWIGIVVFLGGSTCFSMAITFGGIVYPFDSAPEITLWTLTGVLLIAFVLVSIYHPLVPLKHRLYPIHLMKRKELNFLQLAIIIAAGCLVTTLYYTPLLFQFTRGDGALLAGVRLLPFLGGVVFFSILNGAVMPRLGYHMPWFVVGNGLMLSGTAVMSIVDISASDALIYGGTLLIGSGCGAFFTAGFSVVQNLVSESELSDAISYIATAQQMGFILILSVAGTVFQNIASDKIHEVLPGAPDDQIIQLTTGVHSEIFQNLSKEQQAGVVQRVTLAIGNVFLVMVAGSALAFIGSVFLSRRKIWA